jgi:hypothetical protein
MHKKMIIAIALFNANYPRAAAPLVGVDAAPRTQGSSPTQRGGGEPLERKQNPLRNLRPEGEGLCQSDIVSLANMYGPLYNYHGKSRP